MIDEGESEVDMEPDSDETGPSRGTRSRQGRGRRPTTSQSAGRRGRVLGSTKKTTTERAQHSTADTGSEMEVNGEDSNRGRGSKPRTAAQPVSQGVQGMVLFTT